MTDRDADLSKTVRRAFADDPFLSVFAQPLQPFLGKRSQIETSFDRMSKVLAKARLTGVIQLTLRRGRSTVQQCLIMSPAGCEVLETKADRPDVEVITDTETWESIARGEISPLEAFGRGRLRLRGDTRLAQLVASKLR